MSRVAYLAVVRDVDLLVDVERPAAAAVERGVSLEEEDRAGSRGGQFRLNQGSLWKERRDLQCRAGCTRGPGP